MPFHVCQMARRFIVEPNGVPPSQRCLFVEILVQQIT
jgi:hypothetical protein